MRIFTGRKPAELLVEMVIVVAGILVAIGVDSAWQERQDRTSETRLRASLHDEFQSAEGQLEEQMTVYRQRNNAVAELLNLGPAALDLAPDSLNALWLWVSRAGTYDPPSGVLESTIASGDLDLITDRELRIALGEWSGATDNFRSIELNIQDLIHRQFLPWLRLQTPLPERGFGGDWFIPGRNPADMDFISNSFEVENFLREILAWGQIVTGADYERLQSTLDRIQALTAPQT